MKDGAAEKRSRTTAVGDPMTPPQLESIGLKLTLIAAGVWTLAGWLALESLGKLLTP